MAVSFFQYLAIENNEICPFSYNIYAMDDCLEKIENRPILSRDNIDDNKLFLVPASLFY